MYHSCVSETSEAYLVISLRFDRRDVINILITSFIKLIQVSSHILKKMPHAKFHGLQGNSHVAKSASFLTLKAPITTAADDKFWDIFPNFQQN